MKTGASFIDESQVVDELKELQVLLSSMYILYLFLFSSLWAYFSLIVTINERCVYGICKGSQKL